MVRAILRLFGRMLLAILTALWNGFSGGIAAIFMPTFHAIGRWVARLVTVGIIVGGFIVLVKISPQAANAILQIAILVGLTYAGWRYLTRPRQRHQRRRTND